MVDADLELLNKGPVPANAVTYPVAPLVVKQETARGVLPHERAATDTSSRSKTPTHAATRATRPSILRAICRMMPTDFVIGTGKDHSVRDLVEAAFGYLDARLHARLR